MPNTTDLSGFNLPDIAKPNLTGNYDPSYSGIISQIKKVGDLPTMTQSVMPAIQDLLSPTGQKLSPYAKAIETQTAGNVAQTQTDMMKRGLTGSDIEATAMGGARAAGQDAMANMYAQTADQLSQMIFQAATGDINNNRELLLTLAQAMGQELTSQRDMQMFQQALQASIEQANQARNAARNSALMGGLFGAAGATLGGLTGGPLGAMAGLGAGQAAGAGLSGYVR